MPAENKRKIAGKQAKRAKKKRSVKLIASSKIIIIIIFITTTYALGSLGKYTIQQVQDSYLESKSFYFKSNVITDDRNYVLNNWDGVKNYTFVADILNYKNDELWTKEDIKYDVTVSISNNGAICELSGENTDRILKGNNTDKSKDTLTFTLKNNGGSFKKGDSIEIKILAKAKEPYEKTLQSTFKVYVTSLDLNYYIVDSVGSNYCTLYISTNTLDRAININCDYNKVLIDNTNSYVQNGEIETENVNGTTYIKKLKNMLIKKDNVYAIRFYKNDRNKNYQQDTLAISIE